MGQAKKKSVRVCVCKFVATHSFQTTSACNSNKCQAVQPKTSSGQLVLDLQPFL